MPDSLEAQKTAPADDETPAWRRWLPWIALALLILLVAWLLWLYGDWRREADSGKSAVVATNMVRVPNVVGMTAERARIVLRNAGFDVDAELSYDSVAEPGTVANQAPVGGRRAERGSTVIIGVVRELPTLESEEDAEEPDYQGEEKGITGRQVASKPTRAVPDVLGLSESQAIARIEAAGFVARPAYQPRNITKPYVAEQAPDPGDKLEVGEQVHFLMFIPMR